MTAPAGHVVDCQLYAVAFDHADEWNGTAKAFAQGDHNATCAGLVLGKATVNALFLHVVRANVTAEICTVDFNFAVQFFAGVDFSSDGFAQLVTENECRLVLAVKIAGKLNGGRAEGPLAPFTTIRIAASRSV